MTLDAADRILGELDGGDLLVAQRLRQFDGGLETPLRFGHGVLPDFAAIMRRMEQPGKTGLIAIALLGNVDVTHRLMRT
ncbi:hypothetical protein JCM18382A_24970 [Bradyrhizobium sp. 17-4]